MTDRLRLIILTIVLMLKNNYIRQALIRYGNIVQAYCISNAKYN